MLKLTGSNRRLYYIQFLLAAQFTNSKCVYPLELSTHFQVSIFIVGMDVWPACISMYHVYAVDYGGQKRALELQKVICYHVGAGN